MLHLLLACTPTDDDAKTPADTDDTADVATPTATEGPLDLSFNLDASVQGDKRLTSAEILDAVGTLELESVAHATVAYQDHTWDDAGYHLYDLLSIAEDGSNLGVTYLYCSGSDVPYAYTESFLHPMDWETSSGSCDGSAQPSTAAVSLPALTGRPDPVETGISFQTGELADGYVTLDSVAREWIPFNTVDCTDCPGGPWYELHSLLVSDADACFTILYLYPDDPTYADAEYTLCLPSLTRPTGRIDATWTGALNGPPPPHRRPHPPTPDATAKPASAPRR